MVGNKSGAADEEKYTFDISSCCLYVSVGQLNAVLYNQIETNWKDRDVKYFFRRFEVQEVSVGRRKKDLKSPPLFASSQNPLRIYFFLVQADSMAGNYQKNPVIKIYLSGL